MNTKLIALRTYFGLVSLFNPEKAARQGFRLFQEVRKKDTREREELFFEKARKFKIPFDKEPISCFEIGNPNGELVVLVHGWESNAGSMSKFAFSLAEKGKRVMAINLPAHADHKSNYTNLLECKDALLTFLDYLNPKEKFSIVSHSFGSAVVAYALSKREFKINKLVFLTNPNKIDNIMKEFQNFIGIGNRSYRHLMIITNSKLGEPLEGLNVENTLPKIDYDNLLLIHDKYDKALAYRNSFELNSKIEKSQLITMEHIGHYKMLWNEEVIGRTVAFVEGKQVL